MATNLNNSLSNDPSANRNFGVNKSHSLSLLNPSEESSSINGAIEAILNEGQLLTVKNSSSKASNLDPGSGEGDGTRSTLGQSESVGHHSQAGGIEDHFRESGIAQTGDEKVVADTADCESLVQTDKDIDRGLLVEESDASKEISTHTFSEVSNNSTMKKDQMSVSGGSYNSASRLRQTLSGFLKSFRKSFSSLLGVRKSRADCMK